MTQKLSQVRPITKEEQDADDGAVHGQQQAAAQRPQLSARRQCGGRCRRPTAVRALAPRRCWPGFDEADPATWGNPGRNDACPCGSGEKFKHCHGKIV